MGPPISCWLTTPLAYDWPVEFEWDHAKDLSNQRKHGLSFAEVQGIFQGEVDVLEIFDAERSDSEDRFIAIGPIDRGLVVVVYAEPEEDVIRIIGARFATKRERTLYRSHMDRFK